MLALADSQIILLVHPDDGAVRESYGLKGDEVIDVALVQPRATVNEALNERSGEHSPSSIRSGHPRPLLHHHAGPCGSGVLGGRLATP